MDSITKKNCQTLLKNRAIIKKAAKWDYGLNQWLAALLCTMEGTNITEERIRSMRALLKENTGITSRFRGTFSLPAAAVLATSRSSSSLLKNALRFEEALREQGFRRSQYSVLPALLTANSSLPAGLPTIARRSKMFYDAMRENHRLRVSDKDYSTAIILASTELGVEEVINDSERCYEILRPQFPRKTAALGLSYILALDPSRPELKCQRVVDIYEALKDQGLKYGTSYELPSLGILALYAASPQAIAADIGEIVAYLRQQKGCGHFSLSRTQILMFAGALLGLSQETGEAHSQSLTIAASSAALVLATQAAIVASIAATSAATAASSSSSSS